MKRSTSPLLTPVLWTLGALISTASFVFAVLSGTRNCQGDAMCSMSSAVEMLFSVTGVFVGALIIVGGFAARTAQLKIEEQRRQALDLRKVIDDFNAGAEE